VRTLIVLIAFTMAAFGQRHKLEPENTATPEGKTIQQALDETDEAKKAALLEQYVADYPKSGGTTAALELLQAYYLKAGQPDKVIAAGEKLLAIDPADPDAALQSLKAAEAKKDPAMILKWAAATSATARKVAEKPKPAAEDEAADWKAEVDYAKQVDTYSEYALYRASLESTDPKVAIALVEALRQQNPKSEYAAKAADPLFAAYRRAGANDKAWRWRKARWPPNRPTQICCCWWRTTTSRTRRNRQRRTTTWPKSSRSRRNPSPRGLPTPIGRRAPAWLRAWPAT
jgi:hypothetical protein